MARIKASYAVGGGAFLEIEMDVSGMSPTEIADRLKAAHEGVSLCHQCAREIIDPDIEGLSGFTVDGTDYELRDGVWVEYA